MQNTPQTSVSKEVVIEGIVIRFSFSRIVSKCGNKFFVTVYRDEEMAIGFELIQCAEKNWKILPPAPDWVLSIQTIIFELIENIHSLL